MSSPRSRISIALILAIVLVIITGAVLAVFSVFNYRSERDRLMATLRGDLEILVDQSAVSLALPIWNFDRAQIEKIVDSGMQSANVAAIVLVLADVNHSILGRSRDQNWKSVPLVMEPASDGLLTASRSITAGGEAVGVVKIYSTPRFIEAELAKQRRQWIYDIVAIDALLILCLYLLLWRLVLYPVKFLEKQAAAVSGGGKLQEAFPRTAFVGELEMLRNSLLLMINLLNSRHDAVRQMAARIVKIQDEERRKIGRDLHDSTGQTLAALEINLGILSRAAQVNNNSRQNELLHQCIELASKCSTEIRTTSYLLHPPLLDEVGLSSALRWYVDGFSKRSNIAVTLAMPESHQRFSPDVELSLFRVVQEALTNIHRHSGSVTASITLVVHPSDIQITISDRGCGITAEELRRFHEGSPHLGVGLAGMRQRLQQLGGDVQIESNAGGSSVRAWLPREKNVGEVRPEQSDMKTTEA